MSEPKIFFNHSPTFLDYVGLHHVFVIFCAGVTGDDSMTKEMRQMILSFVRDRYYPLYEEEKEKCTF